MRDLEFASAMSSDDFFMTNDNDGESSGRSRSHGKSSFKGSSSSVHAEEIVEDHVN
jgi:hypothetical protein